MRIATTLQQIWQAQQGDLFPWAAVCFGIGISIYFMCATEPGAVVWATLVACAVVGGIVRRWSLCLGWALLLLVTGFATANLRAHWVAAPVLDFRYYGPLEGRVIAIDRSQSDALRLTLDRVRLHRVAPEKHPQKVRISARDLSERPEIGARVMTTAHLVPAGGPVEPGGFDFRRHLWFLQIGAVGYTRVPVLLAERSADELPVLQFRAKITRALHERLPGAKGAIAAAILTGDRSGLSAETVEALRISNLAHLLAISGLHMGLLSGVVFTAIRGLLVVVGLVTGVTLNAKKSAAACALLAAAVYLALSGGNVATERAFIMVAVVLCAVLLGRRALTLRAVALAALVVLFHRPESLLSPGFQMSFAATTALVVIFAHLRSHNIRLGSGWLRPALTLLMSSAIAGFATAPYGAAHFNSISHYGLLANLLAVPVMGGLVMPAAVAAVFLLPIGAEGIALWAMVQGLEWILWVAEYIAALPEPRSYVRQPPPYVLGAMTLGALVLLLARRGVRNCGIVMIACSVLAWQWHERPYILIAEDGGLVGVMSPEGRALSRAKGSGFAARVWLENDGAEVTQSEASARWPQSETEKIATLRGKRATAAFEGCAEHSLVVSNQPLPNDLDEHNVTSSACLILDPTVLRLTGSVAISETGKITTARDKAGLRLWSPAIWRGTPNPLDSLPRFNLELPGQARSYAQQGKAQ